MANTTNFGWETPDDTDLVKDGAAAMRTLGNAIDASLLDLKGGTTGQVLAKNSNTDMDFVWSSVDPLTILDAKGDLISATGPDAPARLAVGTNGQTLLADSTTATGLRWGSVSVNPRFDAIGSASMSGSGTATVSFGSRRANTIFVVIRGASPVTAATTISLRVNGLSTNVYSYFSNQLAMPTTYATTQLTSTNVLNTSSILVGKWSSNAASLLDSGILLQGCNANSINQLTGHSASTAAGGNSGELHNFSGYIEAGIITSISVICSSGNFDAGTLEVWGDQG